MSPEAALVLRRSIISIGVVLITVWTPAWRLGIILSALYCLGTGFDLWSMERQKQKSNNEAEKQEALEAMRRSWERPGSD